jgi:hypothetical protein
MLIEGSRLTKRSVQSPKWLWTLGAVLFGAIVVAFVLLAIHWPFTEKAITRALEAASGRPVQIRTFSKTYFPPGCIAEGIRFLRRKHPADSPIITVEKLVVQGSILGRSPEFAK